MWNRTVIRAYMLNAKQICWSSHSANAFGQETPIFQFRKIFFIYFTDDLYLPFFSVLTFGYTLFRCWFAWPGLLIFLSSLSYLSLLSSLPSVSSTLLLSSLFVFWIFGFYRILFVSWLKYLFGDVSNSFTKFLSMHSIYFLQDAFY